MKDSGSLQVPRLRSGGCFQGSSCSHLSSSLFGQSLAPVCISISWSMKTGRRDKSTRTVLPARMDNFRPAGLPLELQECEQGATGGKRVSCGGLFSWQAEWRESFVLGLRRCELEQQEEDALGKRNWLSGGHVPPISWEAIRAGRPGCSSPCLQPASRDDGRWNRAGNCVSHHGTPGLAGRVSQMARDLSAQAMKSRAQPVFPCF